MAAVPLPYDAAVDALRPGFTPRAWDSGPPVATARFGLWVFLASEAFFFAGLLAAYIVLRGAAGTWALPLDRGLGAVFTALLAACSLAAGLGARRLAAGAHAAGSRWILVAAACGAAFVALQVHEWQHLLQGGFAPRASLPAACFYVLTGAHGLHVLAGVVWLAVAGLAARRKGARTLPAELAVLYQHFVDAVWVVLFLALYLLP
jgi:heme/copper-type cytochrome/quinol oxidase subunit 3